MQIWSFFCPADLADAAMADSQHDHQVGLLERPLSLPVLVQASFVIPSTMPNEWGDPLVSRGPPRE